MWNDRIEGKGSKAFRQLLLCAYCLPYFIYTFGVPFTTSAWDGYANLKLARADFQCNEIDDCARLMEKICSNDSIYIKAIIHRTDFNLKIVDNQLTQRKSANLLGENKFRPTDTAYAMNEIFRFYL